MLFSTQETVGADRQEKHLLFIDLFKYKENTCMLHDKIKLSSL